MIQFFAPDILETLTLPESDSQHCVRVLRKQEGDVIEVIDGRGTRYTCRIVEAHAKRQNKQFWIDGVKEKIGGK